MRRFVPLCVLSLLAVVSLSVVAQEDDKKGDQPEGPKFEGRIVGIEVLEGEGPHTVTKTETQVVRLTTGNPAGTSVKAKVEGDALKLRRHGKINYRIDGKLIPGGTAAEFEFSVVKAGKATIIITTGKRRNKDDDVGEAGKDQTKKIVVNVEEQADNAE